VRDWRFSLVIVGLVCMVLPALAQPNPFSLGGLEGAGGQPSNSLVAWILAKQAEFSRAMTAAARQIKAGDAGALWSLIGLAFSYGIFHAAGPGHGKAIVASYVIANENALKRGATVATLAALLQGLVAIIMVGVIAIVLSGTRQMMTSAINLVELASYAALAAFGTWLAIRKMRGLWYGLRGGGAGAIACDHMHMPDPGEVTQWSLRDAVAAVVAAGVRPCSGAILILVFTLAQGIFFAGMAAVGAMAVGVALTTSGIAAVAVFFKAFAVRMASGRGVTSLVIVRLVEIAAALAVMVLGVLLFAGLWQAS
jgi:nickel/cobalt transporter (NicO) family protein